MAFAKQRDEWRRLAALAAELIAQTAGTCDPEKLMPKEFRVARPFVPPSKW